MARTKIDYGIDLGTTNSAIARIENGDPVIIKTDVLKDTMASCAGFNKKQSVLAGDGAFNLLKSDKLRAMRKWNNDGYNTFIEFKRTMGTDKVYHSAYMDKDYSSEELSAEVLKKLRSFVTDEDLRSVVITVPAKFDIRQKDATLRAAKLAGFQHCELLQEPIAASMSYGLTSSQKDGFWVVFDFGGGTFDAAIVKVEEGIMKVIDTDGDNYLGGKNLDMAIIDEIIIPYLQQEYQIDEILQDATKKQVLQEAMKYYAEEAKIQLSFKEEHNILSDLGDIPGEDDEGEEFELDITIDRAALKKVLAPIFQRAIDITKDLLQRNNLTGDKLDSLILVGGPTYSTILREMLEDQIKKPDTSADPMTAVATGAALYASTLDISEELQEASRDATKIQLDVGYAPSTVETEEWVSLKIIPEKTEGPIPDPVMAEIVRGDQAWSSGKISIDSKGDIVEAVLNEGKTNSFTIHLYDSAGNRLEGQPDRFNIIQGSVVGNAVLPYYIGIGISRKSDGREVFRKAKGLEINQPLPAKGTINGLKTQKEIRPGIETDFIKLPIYQGDYYAEESRAIYNERVYSATISGDDLPALLPEGSDVDLTLTTDKSGRIETIEAYFPYLDYTLDLRIPDEVMSEIESEFLENEFRKAKGAMRVLRENDYAETAELAKIEKEIEYLEQRFEQGKNDYDRKKEVLDNLRKSLKKIDDLTDANEWPQLEAEIKNEFERLEIANMGLGNEQTTRQIEQLRRQMDAVLAKRDVKLGRGLYEDIHNFFIAMTFLFQLMGFIKHHNDNFGQYNWKDARRARQLLQEGKEISATQPTKEKLHPLVVDIISLLPQEQKPAGDNNVLVG